MENTSKIKESFLNSWRDVDLGIETISCWFCQVDTWDKVNQQQTIHSYWGKAERNVESLFSDSALLVGEILFLQLYKWVDCDPERLGDSSTTTQLTYGRKGIQTWVICPILCTSETKLFCFVLWDYYLIYEDITTFLRCLQESKYHVTRRLRLPTLPLLNITFYPLWVSQKAFYLFLLIVIKSPSKVLFFCFYRWIQPRDPTWLKYLPEVSVSTQPTRIKSSSSLCL